MPARLLEGGRHLEYAVQAAISVGEWKLLTGDPGYGDWIPPQTLAAFPGSWWNLERMAQCPPGRVAVQHQCFGPASGRTSLASGRCDPEPC